MASKDLKVKNNRSFKPPTPTSDQDNFFLYDINTISSRQVMWITKIYQQGDRSEMFECTETLSSISKKWFVEMK